MDTFERWQDDYEDSLQILPQIAQAVNDIRKQQIESQHRSN